MPKETPQPPENPEIEPYFCGYIHTPGDADLTLHETVTDFAKAMANKSAQGLVVYIAPAHVIACLMQAGFAPTDAQNLWRGQANPYLTLLRKTRRRLTMLQLPIKDAVATVHTVVSKRMPDATEPVLTTLPVAPELSEPFWLMLAQLHISQNTQIHDSIDTLQSHSIGHVDSLKLDEVVPLIWERWHLRDAQNCQEHNHTTAQITALVEQIVGLEQDLSGIHKNLENALHNHQSHVQELVEQIDAQAQMTQQQTSARNTTQNELEKANAQIKTHQDIQADMQSRIDAKNKQIGTLTAERNWVRDKRKEQEAKTAAHTKDLVQLRTEKTHLQSALTLAEKALSEKTNQMAARIHQLEEAAQSAQTLAEETHGELATQICQLEEAMQLSSVTQGNKNDNSDTAKETLRQVVRQLEASLSMTQRRQDKTTQALHHAQEENTALQAKLDALHASTSWRATKPMRSVSLLVRK